MGDELLRLRAERDELNTKYEELLDEFRQVRKVGTIWMVAARTLLCIRFRLIRDKKLKIKNRLFWSLNLTNWYKSLKLLHLNVETANFEAMQQNPKMDDPYRNRLNRFNYLFETLHYRSSWSILDRILSSTGLFKDIFFNQLDFDQAYLVKLFKL